MEKLFIYFVLFLFVSCSNNDNNLTNTIELTKSEINKVLLNSKNKLIIARDYNDTTQINYLINIFNEANNICLTKGISSIEKKAFLSKLWLLKRDSFGFVVDCFPNIDSSLTNSEFYLHVLISELAFFNEIIRHIEGQWIYHSHRMTPISIHKDNKTIEVYFASEIDTNIMRIYASDKGSIQDCIDNPIIDTNRIVTRYNRDFFTIINKDGKEYEYAFMVKCLIKARKYYPVK